MASSSKLPKTMVVLQTEEGQIFEVEVAVAERSETIKNVIRDLGDEVKPIPVFNVKGKTMSKVLEYCKKHVAFDVEKLHTEEEMKAWDAEFIEVDCKSELPDIILAAQYLDVKDLLDLGTTKVANIIKGKQPEEIREILGIKDEFAEGVVEKFMEKYKWAFGESIN